MRMCSLKLSKVHVSKKIIYDINATCNFTFCLTPSSQTTSSRYDPLPSKRDACVPWTVPSVSEREREKDEEREREREFFHMI